MKEVLEIKEKSEVFRSVKTGEKYSSYAEMLQAEAEYDRLEREEELARAVRNESKIERKENKESY
ncbi:MAG: hypothetical protein HYT62_01280 [Candidatus Yanofskybacteria bacterium]|nr:hypothetical protein [Candidatus Yanofskybacteria bacterium]